jgi:hypothetical protein
MVGFLFSILGQRQNHASDVKTQISEVMNHPNINKLIEKGTNNIRNTVNNGVGKILNMNKGPVAPAVPTLVPSVPSVQSEVK